ncbi:MAG: hypothetical protein Q8S21_06745 [Candidatus Paracaedibacteraceae bacterium]|nr:hypothetical protein [Candidatus Paracaedibacteraceae bacterium]
MNDGSVNTLRHRIKLGRYSESENDEGALKRHFKPIKDAWAEIKPVSQNYYFRNESVHESNLNAYKNGKKNAYKIKIRKNVVSKGRHEQINAILWKYKILTNFYNLRPDETEIFLEGVFCEQGSGVN